MSHKYKKIPFDNNNLSIEFYKRILTKDLTTNECVLWNGTILKAGYGCMRFNGLIFLAHRVSFAIHKEEPLIDGMVIDHLCNNRSCVNPNHLKQTTIIKNARRGMKFPGSHVNTSLPHLLFLGMCRHEHSIRSFDDLRRYKVNSTIYYSCAFCAREASRKQNLKNSIKKKLNKQFIAPS